MPDNSNRIGIRNCFKEESPERIQEVILIGKAIVIIFFFICTGKLLLDMYFLLSIR